MLKKIVAMLLLCGAATIMIVACGRAGGSSGTADIHMGTLNFVQSSITISKGSSLKLIDDVAGLHIINNGSWVDGSIKPVLETGAPTVSNVQFATTGQSQMVGPFNIVGTYHLYCTIHPGMNLTVIVQ